MLATVHQSLAHSEALSVLAGHLGQQDQQLQEDLANCGVLSFRLSRAAEVWLDVDLRLRPAKSKSTLKVLIVQEPPDVKQLQLEGFDLVLTWQQQHLELRQSRFFVPATPWLLPAEWPRFLSKKPGLGFLRGSKSQTAGHRLRHRIWEAREQLQSACEVPLEFLQGGGISRDERNLQFFNQFVLVIENSSHENYFSEKLLDALLTQSMPVYWGCPNIGDFFDVAGMIVLRSTEIDEVLSVCNQLCPARYEAHQEALQRNRERAERYSGDFGLRLQQAIEEALQAQTDIGQSGPGAWDEIASPSAKKAEVACVSHADAPVKKRSQTSNEISPKEEVLKANPKESYA